MPKLPSLKPRIVVKKLKTLGFIEHHQVGSHLTMKHHSTGKRAVVPMHLKDIRKGTLLSLLHEAGIEKDEFIDAYYLLDGGRTSRSPNRNRQT